MEIHPENCIVVVDAQAGIAASRAAGMLSVGMGPAGRVRKADLVFPERCAA